jgi:hypothetical protein
MDGGVHASEVALGRSRNYDYGLAGRKRTDLSVKSANNADGFQRYTCIPHFDSYLERAPLRLSCLNRCQMWYIAARPSTSHSERISANVRPSSTVAMALRTSNITRRTAQCGKLEQSSHGRLVLRLAQAMGARGPSSTRTIWPIRTSEGGRARTKPPPLPFLLWTNPALRKSPRMASRNFFGIAFFAAISATSVGFPGSAPARCTIAFRPYFPFFVSMILPRYKRYDSRRALSSWSERASPSEPCPPNRQALQHRYPSIYRIYGQYESQRVDLHMHTVKAPLSRAVRGAPVLGKNRVAWRCVGSFVNLGQDRPARRGLIPSIWNPARWFFLAVPILRYDRLDRPADCNPLREMFRQPRQSLIRADCRPNGRLCRPSYVRTMWEVEALARGTADAGNRKKYGAQENSGPRTPRRR